MTDTSDQDKDRRDREAANWCARMNGGDAEQIRPEFEAWLRKEPGNRAAYNSMMEVYLLGRKLKGDRSANNQPVRRKRDSRWGAALACGLLLLASLLAMRLTRSQDAHAPINSAEIAEQKRWLVSGDTGRDASLADGSHVQLDSHSELKIALTAERRLFTLQQGGAQFEVAHENRPFVVSVGGGTVTAKGTVFHVAINPSRQVQVRLIKGRVDVQLPRSPLPGHSLNPVRHMEVGEIVEFAGAPLRSNGAANGPSAMLPLPRTWTVAELVSAANVSSPGMDQIVLADGTIRNLELSGSFLIHDPATVAERLASIFDLTLDRSEPGKIILRRR